MSNQNFSSPQPNPLETEAYLEPSSSTAIDVTAVDVTSETSELSEAAKHLAIAESTKTANQDAAMDGFLIARKLRQHNRELVQTVVQLEQALAESQAKLQDQITRSRNADTLISQQADDLNGSQSQISRLQQELETAKQTARNYQDVAIELEQQLQLNQTQLAKIERECALLQESYNEQQQKLFAAEQEIQDLQNRLQRQQRYTLQYKSALEQRAEAPEAIDIARPSHQVPKVTRIQPWSAQAQSPQTQSPEVQSSQGDRPTEPTNNNKVTPFPTAKAEPAAPVVDIAKTVKQDLEQQLESLEQQIEHMSQAVESVTPPAPQVPVMPKRPMPPQFPALSNPGMIAQPKPVELPGRRMAGNPLPSHRNFPSPTLNPLRTPKKRTSLAAVDLPTFPRR